MFSEYWAISIRMSHFAHHYNTKRPFKSMTENAFWSKNTQIGAHIFTPNRLSKRLSTEDDGNAITEPARVIFYSIQSTTEQEQKIDKNLICINAPVFQSRHKWPVGDGSESIAFLKRNEWNGKRSDSLFWMKLLQLVLLKGNKNCLLF